jgi:hypothetical protein
MEEIYYFCDWVSCTLERSDYSEFQLINYKDYYEHIQNQHDRI